MHHLIVTYKEAGQSLQEVRVKAPPSFFPECFLNIQTLETPSLRNVSLMMRSCTFWQVVAQMASV